ncbi:MAG: hypothetical protein HKN39_01780 [Flavobacteriales bacterium]|nr:hypothetical protein [Flavobacteriales bacterium]
MGGLLRFLWLFLIAYLIIRIGKRLLGFSSRQRRDYDFTNEDPRQEGDVVIERTAPKKGKEKTADKGDFVDYEEVKE